MSSISKPVWILVALLGLAACNKQEQGVKQQPTADQEQASSQKPSPANEPAQAHEAAHAHGHDHDHEHVDPDQAAAKLVLDNGKKWQTDDSLRAGMTAIRDRLQSAVVPIHADTFSADDYKGLAADIDKEIGNIAANCKLPKDADDQLHLVLAQIIAGTEAMKKGSDGMAGAVKVIRGLGSYEKFFEHPEWKGIEH